jgi:hypothetical protein
MVMEPNFIWEEDTGSAICTIVENGKTYMGIAKCHPDDNDMMSEKTGCEIAFRRAKIECLRGIRDEQKCELRAFNRLYYTMNKSKKFNPKSYENIMLHRQIRMTEFDLATTKEILAHEEADLRRIIDEKDKFYKRTRARRDLAQYN